ncbi:hypothetical protein [Synechococcus sp. 7002]|uniref:hypothetical protein n=1 Tax=Synechococcus sp. 7002 TaxID=1938862 RepID=UPI001F3BF474|nr:hypothetical protein [Synechococcus sp. 7002]
MNMQLFRSPLSRLAIATTLLSSSLTFMPQMAEARQPCGSFTINWGGRFPKGTFSSVPLNIIPVPAAAIATT